MAHEVPQLGYEYDALEPHIDAKTMEIHHSKHHAAYVKKLNAALENHEELQDKSVEELIRNLNDVFEEVRTAVRNHGGGHYNHSIFWPMLKKDVEPQGEILQAIKDTFGSLEDFQEKFKNTALGIFGSGWAWLVVNPQNGNALEIVKTPNQDNPLTEGKIPILGIDMWEHAYYLKHQNEKAKYVDDFFQVINWEQINQNYLKSTQQE
ncbi:MAG: superoxide dismutase [Candidatus Pacearchaeota archaeon]